MRLPGLLASTWVLLRKDLLVEWRSRSRVNALVFFSLATLLLFPVLIPALVAAAKGTTLVFEGDPMEQFNSWVILLAGFDIVYWGLGLVLFPRVIEE